MLFDLPTDRMLSDSYLKLLCLFVDQQIASFPAPAATVPAVAMPYYTVATSVTYRDYFTLADMVTSTKAMAGPTLLRREGHHPQQDQQQRQDQKPSHQQPKQQERHQDQRQQDAWKAALQANVMKKLDSYQDSYVKSITVKVLFVK